jgi:hypothetical protein
MLIYSLLRPIAGLTWLQLLLWPWIYVQAMQLKRRIRARYGRGVPYRWRVTPLGRVYLTEAPFLPHKTGTARAALTVAFVSHPKTTLAPARAVSLALAQGHHGAQALGLALAEALQAFNHTRERIAEFIHARVLRVMPSPRLDSS